MTFELLEDQQLLDECELEDFVIDDPTGAPPLAAASSSPTLTHCPPQTRSS